MKAVIENITKKHLMAKATGFIQSIETMDEKRRAAAPTGAYGDDYNKLRSLTAQLYPVLKDFLPPPVEFYQGGDSGKKYTCQSYDEIHTYCDQIYHILSETT
jgi:hypothetical protein